MPADSDPTTIEAALIFVRQTEYQYGRTGIERRRPADLTWLSAGVGEGHEASHNSGLE